MIYVFDRKREDLDAFSIATAVVVPSIAIFVFRMFAGYFEFGIWAAYAEIGLLAVCTYLVLNLNLGFKPGRSAVYTFAVIVFNIIVAVLLAVWIGNTG